MKRVPISRLSRALGVPGSHFCEPKLEHVGLEVETYSVRMAKAVRGVWRRGERVFFPVRIAR